MRFILLTFLLLFISSCKPINQRLSEADIKKVVSDNWAAAVPYDGLLATSRVCLQHPDFDGCDLVISQIYDISLSYKSCLYDQRSKLCKVIIDEVRASRLYLYLPKTKTLELPSTPFYWTLPTRLLEAKSSPNEYRDEAWNWLWYKVKYYVLAAVLAALVAIFYFCFKFYLKNAQEKKENERALEMDRQREVEKHQMRLHEQMLREESRKQQAAKKAEEERQKIMEEEQRIALEAKVAYEKQIKIAKEKNEIDAMLKEIFNGE